MDQTFINPKTCGFGRVAAIYSAKQSRELIGRANSSIAELNARYSQSQYEMFNDIFKDRASFFEMEFKVFKEKFKALQTAINKWSPRKKDEKTRYFDLFSVQKWQQLSEAKKREHTLFDCKGCHQNYSLAQSLFPVKLRRFVGKAKENPFVACRDVANRIAKQKLPSKTAIKETAKGLYEAINSVFESVSGGTSFAEALTKVPKANLEKRKSPLEKKKIRRNILRDSKQQTEAQWKETSIIRCLGNQQSLKARPRERLTSSFESCDSAKARREQESMDPEEKRRKTKDHTGSLENISWDKEALRQEVKGYEDGKEVNWTALAKEYNVTDSSGKVATNGGQIVKEFLQKDGVDVNRLKRPYEYKGEGKRIRRKKLLGMGGEITLPTAETNEEVKEVLKLKIQNKEFTVGELIVPKKYKKLLLDNKGNVITKEFIIEGRKMPLDEIRKKTLEIHCKYMRHHDNSYYDDMSRIDVSNRLMELNEFDDSEGLEAMRKKVKAFERQRNLLIWHDHSMVANHGHLVFMISCAYDPAIFYTPEEYCEINGCTVDIQTEVEKPEIYIVGRCSSSEVEQLAYTETRCECLKGLSTPLEVVPGVPINDVMRFFKVDGPAVAFETGQQKGGHYFCSVSGIHAVMSDDLEYIFRCKHVSLEDKQTIILKGKTAKKNSQNQVPKPLHNLKKDDIINELKDRELLPSGYDDKDIPKENRATKTELQVQLTAELHGIQRVPAVLYTTPTSSLSSHNLHSYEPLPCEPMHNLSNHISNILEELPSHLTAEQKSIFNETMELTLGSKETKRATDYRLAILLFSQRLKNFLPETLNTLLTTLIEMQEILYSKDYSRSPRLIYRYHNVSFLHFLMIKIEFGSTPITLTSRKLYRKYLHNLISHAPIQLRLIFGSSSNAENEERTFDAIKNITASTSNYRPSHVISNVLLRLQAEQKMGARSDAVQKQQNAISKAALSIQALPNTRISSFILEEDKYSRMWQAHLERISDFLLPGEGIWWRYIEEFNEIELLDSNSEPDSRQEGPLLHHFRSSSFTQEEDYLAQCWSECIERSVRLPTHVLYKENASGKVIREQTNYLRMEDQECTSDHESFPEDYVGGDAYKEILETSEHAQEEEEERVIGVCLDDDEPNVCDEIVDYNNCNLQFLDECTHTCINKHPNIAEKDEGREHSETDQTQVGDNSYVKKLHRAHDHLETNSPSNDSSYLIHPVDLATTNSCSNAFNSENNIEMNTLSNNINRSQEIETKIGKAIETVLGSTEEVRKVDRARMFLKNNSNSTYGQQNYEDALAPVQSKILAKKRDLKSKLNDWDRKFLDNNCVGPSYEEIQKNQFASKCLKKLKFCEALLKKWNITL